ncbi:crispr-associated protein, Csm1 family [Treponema primitia ZAS-2]|uniref:CRISPR system single-strand-specific deoxyribonuclease Cas10/Csm1 (subtype III-A) n=1 Tax=Treponema primitia (strain ATCC BAA-887 / DSM 12427 / ZAS-2) TaxID=545694 RepID=F5YHB1_TREPZ|nr:type III-A CRISPR-associated protein Cas10/Csm1 [Treponema primitia]AEF84418.1 crispr-associated protein, Csm1 family [Treponema primitia ZAS-2]
MDDIHASYNEVVLAAWLHGVDGLYGDGFLQSLKPYFPADVRPDEVIRLASAYRNPSGYDEGIIAHACGLGCGVPGKTERAPSPFEKPLVHMVSALNIDNRKSVHSYYVPGPMDGSISFSAENQKTGKEPYREIMRGFEKDFQALSGKGWVEFMPALDTLFEHYLWCVPSGTDPLVSFYQYSKSTAAFAGALYRYHQAAGTESLEALSSGKEAGFLFINGDMSGIQRYIFDLKDTKQSAKMLRARSFQVWALSEVIAEYLALCFKGSRESIISSAGGKFLLMVANTQENRNAIPGLRLELERYFAGEFAGKLMFILSDGVSAGDDDLGKGLVQDLLNRIGTDAEWAKQRKMQTFLDAEGPVLESFYSSLLENGECACCGVLPGKLPYGDGGDKKICPNCSDLIALGGKLLRANRVVLKTEKLLPLGSMIAIQQKNESPSGYTINEYKAGSPLMFLPYVAPWMDEKRGILKTFEDIAGCSKGSNKLAMFKADIDNLGLVFSSSLGDRVSFAAYAALSRQLHYFFSAYYARFVNGHPEYSEKIYTVFSGGDDLCVLGAWDAVMRFAGDFRKELEKFTNRNPSVTLSGGIAMANPALPVRNIAEEADAALEMAKGRQTNGGIVKNGICVFGVTVSWEEYDKLLDEGEKFFKYLNEGKLSAGLVYKMIDFANRAKNFRIKGNLRDMVWASNFRYMAARNIPDEKLRNWFLKFGTTENIEKSRIAVSYALYARRHAKEE